ncbi:hypothetical protein PTTG_08149 [Puccinia triticina 1-1 BBBD Race 1]|uniref:Uncharacterized protein n=1 Tax=Puccinia triticina (isolate 1-1 / race 1 (BBBD)) TaxID=630390 RepID=A0A0C4F4V7_PUCT1|nr:hypothetical protein PTTG_08149 [Puccinia triticina 1-1 BBBD Race 1]
MFSRFLVVALLSSITRVWGVVPPEPTLLSLDDFVPIKETARIDRFPFMSVKPSDDNDRLVVAFAMENPDTNNNGYPDNDPDGPQAIEALKLVGQPGWTVADKNSDMATDDSPNASITHWTRYHARTSILGGPTAKILDRPTAEVQYLINKICTQQINTPASIILFPVAHKVYIQYPQIASGQTAQTFVREEKTLQQLKSALEEIESSSNVAGIAIADINWAHIKNAAALRQPTWPSQSLRS